MRRAMRDNQLDAHRTSIVPTVPLCQSLMIDEKAAVDTSVQIVLLSAALRKSCC
jgi:hypothetical protein